MSFADIIQSINTGGWIAIVIIIGSIIEISPIKINPWTHLVKWIGRSLNQGVIDRIINLESQVKELKTQLLVHTEENELEYVDSCRSKIIDFAGESLRNIRHTREQYNRILARIDKYEKYCNDHPKFPNSQCISSINIIKKSYEEHMINHDFLDSLV